MCTHGIVLIDSEGRGQCARCHAWMDGRLDPAEFIRLPIAVADFAWRLLQGDISLCETVSQPTLPSI